MKALSSLCSRSRGTLQGSKALEWLTGEVSLPVRSVISYKEIFNRFKSLCSIDRHLLQQGDMSIARTENINRLKEDKADLEKHVRDRRLKSSNAINAYKKEISGAPARFCEILEMSYAVVREVKVPL